MQRTPWPKGKDLKPFLCLIKMLSANPYPRPTKEQLLTELHRAFPYYAISDLENMIDNFPQSQFSYKQLCTLKHHLWSNEYREESEQIASPNLYHFLKKEHLLSALKKNFIYPSILSINEYMQSESEFAEQILQNTRSSYDQMLLHWQDSAKELERLRTKGATKARINKFLTTSSFLPAYNCFTELPNRSFKLHSDHYGSYGLSFQKQRLLSPDRHYMWMTYSHRTTETVRDVFPIHYCDCKKSTYPWVLISNLCKDGISEELRRALIRDLALTKPIDESLLSPVNIYSVIFEREWRYISFQEVFNFNMKMIDRVLISKADYADEISGKAEDPILREILEIVPPVKIRTI